MKRVTFPRSAPSPATVSSLYISTKHRTNNHSQTLASSAPTASKVSTLPLLTKHTTNNPPVGHTKVRCKEPIAELPEGGGDGGFGESGGFGASDAPKGGAAPASASFGDGFGGGSGGFGNDDGFGAPAAPVAVSTNAGFGGAAPAAVAAGGDDEGW